MQVTLTIPDVVVPRFQEAGITTIAEFKALLKVVLKKYLLDYKKKNTSEGIETTYDTDTQSLQTDLEALQDELETLFP